MSSSVEMPWKPATSTIWPRSRASWIRRARTSTIFAFPWTVSVTIPACEPVREIASWPRSWIAIAASEDEIRSPTEISMSSSRGFGLGDPRCASATSSSVVCPIAERTATMRLPPSRAAAIRRATPRIFSGSATDVPPNFITTVPALAAGAAGSTPGTASYSVAVIANSVGADGYNYRRETTAARGAVGHSGGARRPQGAALDRADSPARPGPAPALGAVADDHPPLAPRVRALGRRLGGVRRRGDPRLRAHRLRRMASRPVAPGRRGRRRDAPPLRRLVRHPALDRRREGVAGGRPGRSQRDPARHPLLLDRLGHGPLLGALAADCRPRSAARCAAGRARSVSYISRRPDRARPRVTSSAYSRSPPTGRPLARRVTRTRPRSRSAR